MGREGGGSGIRREGGEGEKACRNFDTTADSISPSSAYLQHGGEFSHGLGDGVLRWLGGVGLRPLGHWPLVRDRGRLDERRDVTTDGCQVELGREDWFW